MLRNFVLLAAITPALALPACGQEERDMTQTYDPAVIEADIWAKEAAIFEGRGRGDLSNYLNVTSMKYLGWPPVMADPLPLDNFRKQSAQSDALKGEKITFEKEGFTISGQTAVTYFTSHRTRLGDGFAPEGERDVDQYYENTHIWTFEDGEWRLIGGMARLLPEGPREPVE